MNDVLTNFEDKVRLLVAHVSLLKKENLSLRNQIMTTTGGDSIANSAAVQNKVKQLIDMIDAELEVL